MIGRTRERPDTVQGAARADRTHQLQHHLGDDRGDPEGCPGRSQPGHPDHRPHPHRGPETAEGWLDSYLSAAAVLDLLRRIQEPFDAVVMAGFGEHGREGARELLDVPVIDITEAAAHLACLLGRRYAVVTTLDRTCGQIEDSLHTAGVAQHCTAVLGTGLGVLDLVDNERTAAAFIAAGRRARQTGAEVLVLGCAGMTGLERRVSTQLGMPVVDGVAAAVRLAESLVALGLSTSRAGSYAKPLPKQRRWGPPEGWSSPPAGPPPDRGAEDH